MTAISLPLRQAKLFYPESTDAVAVLSYAYLCYPEAILTSFTISCNPIHKQKIYFNNYFFPTSVVATFRLKVQS
jgi:hypothetical protein